MPQTQHKHLIIIELDETMPRREPALPHLYVALCGSVPEKRFSDVLSGKGRQDLRGRYVCLRPDLSDYWGAALSEQEAPKVLSDEKLRLTRLGHAVNGDVSVWHGYVLDLRPPPKGAVAGKKYVYVGMTSRSPEERLLQHAGVLTSRSGRDIGAKRGIRERHLGLNYELMSSLWPTNPVYTQADALALESAWANELFSRGYGVEAGPATPGKTSKKTRR